MTTLVLECDKDPRAVAFNTDGFIKHSLRPADQWSDIPNDNGNEGLYVKKAPSALTDLMRLNDCTE